MDYYCWLVGWTDADTLAGADADMLAGKHQRGCSPLAAEVGELYHWMTQKGHGTQKDWELVHHRQDVGKLCRLHHRIGC